MPLAAETARFSMARANLAKRFRFKFRAIDHLIEVLAGLPPRNRRPRLDAPVRHRQVVLAAAMMSWRCLQHRGHRGWCGRSPAEICVGTSPSSRRSRGLVEYFPVPIAATIALEMTGPLSTMWKELAGREHGRTFRISER